MNVSYFQFAYLIANFKIVYYKGNQLINKTRYPLGNLEFEKLHINSKTCSKIHFSKIQFTFKVLNINQT